MSTEGSERSPITLKESCGFDYLERHSRLVDVTDSVLCNKSLGFCKETS